MQRRCTATTGQNAWVPQTLLETVYVMYNYSDVTRQDASIRLKCDKFTSPFIMPDNSMADSTQSDMHPGEVCVLEKCIYNTNS